MCPCRSSLLTCAPWSSASLGLTCTRDCPDASRTARSSSASSPSRAPPSPFSASYSLRASVVLAQHTRAVRRLGSTPQPLDPSSLGPCASAPYSLAHLALTESTRLSYLSLVRSPRRRRPLPRAGAHVVVLHLLARLHGPRARSAGQPIRRSLQHDSPLRPHMAQRANLYRPRPIHALRRGRPPPRAAQYACLRIERANSSAPICRDLLMPCPSLDLPLIRSHACLECPRRAAAAMDRL